MIPTEIWITLKNLFIYDISIELIKHMKTKCHVCKSMTIPFKKVSKFYFCSLNCYNCI